MSYFIINYFKGNRSARDLVSLAVLLNFQFST